MCLHNERLNRRIGRGAALSKQGLTFDAADINTTKASVETDKISEVFAQFGLIPEPEPRRIRLLSLLLQQDGLSNRNAYIYRK
jgi:hypothetical protein